MIPNTPIDYDNPDWTKTGSPYYHVHNWRNHVPELVREIWVSFNDSQKKCLAIWAEELANREEWE